MQPAMLMEFSREKHRGDKGMRTDFMHMKKEVIKDNDVFISMSKNSNFYK